MTIAPDPARPMRTRTAALLLAVLLALTAPAVAARVLQVGPGKLYTLPSQAAKVALDGDVVEIDAGDYRADTAVWKANGLTLRGVGGMAHLKSQGKIAKGKGIWLIKGNDTTVEYVGFHDARSSQRNGAGIRLEGTNLTVRHALFRNNDNGILTGKDPESTVRVEHSEFVENGHGDGQSHNLYIGAIRSFTLTDSVSRRARIGHQVKSRAAENVIVRNRIVDEASGNSSYLIDLPVGGIARIEENFLQQGPRAENATLVSFGAERKKPLHAESRLTVENNTFVNDRGGRCVLVFVREGAPTATVRNNRFAGCTRFVGPIDASANRMLDRSALPATSDAD